MNNQTIDGVPRKLLTNLLAWLERANERNDDGDIAEYVELRVLLDAPAVQWLAMEVNGKSWVIKEGPNAEKWRAMGYELFPVQPAAQPQGEPVAYRYKELQQAWESEKPWELATVSLGRVYLERKELAERGVLVGGERETYLGMTIEPLTPISPRR